MTDEVDEKRYVVAAGGFRGSEVPQKTVEVIEISNEDAEWEEGPDLPRATGGAPLIGESYGSVVLIRYVDIKYQFWHAFSLFPVGCFIKYV